MGGIRLHTFLPDTFMHLHISILGAIAILAANWDVVAPKWGQISKAFQKAFNATAASIAIALPL